MCLTCLDAWLRAIPARKPNGNIRVALAMRLQAMLDDHDPIPPADSNSEYVEMSLMHPVA